MAGRQLTPGKGTIFSTGAALMLIATSFAGPALAAAPSPELCADSANASLKISTRQLEASRLDAPIRANGLELGESDFDNAVAAEQFPSSKADVEVQRVFRGTAAPLVESPFAESPLVGRDEQPAAKASMPGVSDVDLARFKRQMYRRDI